MKSKLETPWDFWEYMLKCNGPFYYKERFKKELQLIHQLINKQSMVSYFQNNFIILYKKMTGQFSWKTHSQRVCLMLLWPEIMEIITVVNHANLYGFWLCIACP